METFAYVFFCFRGIERVFSFAMLRIQENSFLIAMKKIIMTSVLQVVCIALTIVSIQAEVLGGAIGFGVCTLLCIPTIIRYSIEYGKKR